MKENVSGCFFLNTVVLICYLSCRYLFILSVCSAGVCLRCLLSVSVPFCYYWLLIYYEISYGRPACWAVGFSDSPLPCSFTVVFLLYIVYWRWQINMMMMIHVSASKQAPFHLVRGCCSEWRRQSVSLSSTSTLNFHSPQGAAVSWYNHLLLGAGLIVWDR